jgi:hypothetical protein
MGENQRESEIMGKQDAVYTSFRVIEYTQSTFFTRELKAYDRSGKEMPLPTTVKNMYRQLEAAQDVCRLIELLFSGKTTEECERMLGL